MHYICTRYKNVIITNMKKDQSKRLQQQIDAINSLVLHQIKPSMQRIAIMDYLITHRTHPSADEIYEKLSIGMPTLSKTTVYNTLKLFASNGAAQMITIDEHQVNFDADTSTHAHFLCKQCGKIYDLSLPELATMPDMQKIEGHLVKEISYFYKGICKDCLAKGTKDSNTN